MPKAEALKEYAKFEAEAVKLQGCYPEIFIPRTNAWFKFYGNPILEPGPPGSWEEKSADCQTVGFYNGQYMMWYVGTPRNLDCQIGLATSPDGINWTKHPENPLIKLGPPGSWDEGILICESVIFDKEESLFKIWYVGGGNHGIFGIGYATSPDGIHWTKYPGNPVIRVTEEWEGNTLEGQTVIKTPTGYRIWFSSYEIRTDQSEIGYAESPDGIHWTKDPNNPIFKPDQPDRWDGYSVDEPEIHIQSGFYHMWYKGWRQPMGVSWVGHATSQDGIHWVRDRDNPVLITTNLPKVWDNFQVYRPRVILNTEWEGDLGQAINRMWYSGRPYSLKARLGFAIQFAQVENDMDWRRKIPFVTQDRLALTVESKSRESVDLYYFTPWLDKISVTIYNRGGRKVKTLVTETNMPGYYQTAWDRRDSLNNRVPAGIYYCEIMSASHLLTKEIILDK